MDLPEDVTDDEWWEQTLRRWEATLELPRQWLADADTAMVRAYTRHVPPSVPDTRDQFTKGCSVLMKQRQPGNSKLQATGPYRFDGFCGVLGTVADTTGQNEQTIRTSAANLVPYWGLCTEWAHHPAPSLSDSDEDDGEVVEVLV